MGNGNACLFDLSVDPCEWNDISSENKEVYNSLLRKLHDYNSQQAYPMFRLYPENGSLANPDQFGGFWSPWENTDAPGYDQENLIIDDVDAAAPSGHIPEDNVFARSGIIGLFRSETIISQTIFVSLSALLIITLLYYYWTSRRGYKQIVDVKTERIYV